MKDRLYKIGIFLISFSNLLAQDSLNIESLLSIDMNGQHNLAAFANNFDCFNCGTSRVRDNPFFHFAIYLGVTNKLIINDNFKIETAIFSEERSHSGGNNTLANIIFFPKILLEAKDTFDFLKKKIGVKLKGGDYWDEDVQDILRLYNIDYHCLQMELSKNKWALSFMTIGDLSSNVGLDLTQVYRTSLGYRSARFNNSTHVSLNELSTSEFATHTVDTDWNISNYSKFTFSENSFIEGQFSIRLNRDLNTSFAAALIGNYKANQLSLFYGLRYYEATFNRGYNGRKPRYSRSGEFVGDQLYPLKNYYRPFSQWAVFTHTQNQNILALEIGAQWEKKLYKKFYFFNDFDINTQYSFTEKTFKVFPFYNIGLNCKFLNQLHARLSLTNKQMNLYSFYQTSEAGKIPFLSLGVRMKLNEIQWMTKHGNKILPSS